MEKKEHLICSSNTLIDLSYLINKFYYSTTYKVLPDLTVIWSKGVKKDLIVKKKGSRYLCYVIF